MEELQAQERSFGASTVFRVAPGTDVSTLASRLTRRDRWVFLLLDGRRTLADVAHLTHHSELDVAYTLARFLQWGYIEPVNTEEDRASRFESGYGSV